MDYKIVTDSTIDLPLDLIQKLNIEVLNLGYSINGVMYKNDIENPEFTAHEFFDLIKNGNIPITNHVYEADIMDRFREILDNNLDIIYICFSQALSKTYKSALIVKDKLQDEYPERKIMIIDSRAASMGEGLLVYFAAKKKEEGLSISELYKWIEENKLNIWHWFMVDDIKYLKNGGRVKLANCVFSNTLKVKPILYVDGLGRIIQKYKAIGRKKSIEVLIEKMKTNYVPNTPIFIAHADVVDDAYYLRDEILKNFKTDEIIINYIGPVIGSHSGCGTLALFYVGTDARIVEE